MCQTKEDILEKLNIADSFTLAIDDEIRRDGLAGSNCGFALELDNTPDIETLKQRIDEFGQQFPVALASLQQRGKHFYWCKRLMPPQLFFQHICPEDKAYDAFLNNKVDQFINFKQDRELTSPIEFHLISGTTKNTFFIRWIHPFCDARGADLILKYLCTGNASERQQFGLPATKPLVYVQLDKYKWWQKLVLLFKGKRYVDTLDKLESIQPYDTNSKPQRLNLSIKKLTIEQTHLVISLTRKRVGLTGTSLYYIGCLMRALDKINPGSDGEAYCVPYAFNLRKQRAKAPMTGNHVCALFAQTPREIVRDRTKLFSYLKQQNMDVIRQQLDYAFLPLMWAGSWLSLVEYGKILRLTSSGKERNSFWFSDIGKLDIPVQSFPGAQINSVFHVCQVTTPPALAFLSCIFQDQLTLSYNYVEPNIKPDQIEQLHQILLAELLEQEDLLDENN